MKTSRVECEAWLWSYFGFCQWAECAARKKGGVRSACLKGFDTSLVTLKPKQRWRLCWVTKLRCSVGWIRFVVKIHKFPKCGWNPWILKIWCSLCDVLYVVSYQKCNMDKIRYVVVLICRLVFLKFLKKLENGPWNCLNLAQFQMVWFWFFFCIVLVVKAYFGRQSQADHKILAAMFESILKAVWWLWIQNKDGNRAGRGNEWIVDIVMIDLDLFISLAI